jgi:GT2 family glycosyltransferase
VHNPSNPGYGAAHNLGIKESLKSGVDYHLVLNSDVTFDLNLLEDIFKYAEDHREMALISPKMLFEDGNIQCNRKLLPTPLNMFLRAFLPSKYRSRLDKKFELANLGYKDLLHVPYVSGAFMFLRVSALKKVGLFDEKFFMYPEDIDLSRRIASFSGVYFVPNFVITHKYGGASHKSIRMFIIHAYNMFLYFNKWGWIFDKQRTKFNKRTINQLNRLDHL